MKIIIALIAILFITAFGIAGASGSEERIAGSTAKSEEMSVTVDAYCDDYNKVGNEWYCTLTVNGATIVDREPITNDGQYPKGELTTVANQQVCVCAGDMIAMNVGIEEFDKGKSDFGEDNETVIVTQSDIDNGFSIKFEITVNENGGTYSGRQAKWTVICSFDT